MFYATGGQMKTELKFTILDDDAEDKIHRLTNCDGAFAALWDIQSYLREQYKYNDDLPDNVISYLGELRDRVYEILEENNIDLDRDYA